MYPERTIFALLYFGAAYAAVFGACQIGAGLWLRHALRHPRTYSSLGAFAPAHW